MPPADGEVYKREAGGWKQYDADSGEWELTNYSKAKDIKKIQDHRAGDTTQPAATSRAKNSSTTGTDQAANTDSSQGRFGNRDAGSTQDRTRELNEAARSRSEGAQRYSTFSSGGGYGGGGSRYGGRRFRWRRQRQKVRNSIHTMQLKAAKALRLAAF